MRSSRAVCASALIDTVPLPVPLAPPVIRSQLAVLVAVQVHEEADAETPTEPEPPSGRNRCVDGVRENVHVTGSVTRAVVAALAP